jgi:hypothetical protein
VRIIYRIPPIPGAVMEVPNGPTLRGFADFFVTVYEPGEAIPPGPDPKPMSVWRHDPSTAADGSMRVSPAPFLKAAPGVVIPDVVIPSSVLNDLPDDALLNLSWRVSAGVPK